MKPLKFRAWDKQEKCWDTDHVFLIFRTGELFVVDARRNLSGVVPNRYEAVWFTGLLDKNGKEIYDGDIVRHGNHNHAIEFPKDYSAFYQYGLEGEVTVIGNIWENPELLEEKK